MNILKRRHDSSENGVINTWNKEIKTINMKNNLKYIRKHKHWYERTINKINQCYINKMLKKCNLCGKILNEPNIIYSDDTYEFVRGNISINKVNIDSLNNKEKKLFNKLIILFDINSYDIVLI